MICSPEAVVIGFPAAGAVPCPVPCPVAWALAPDGTNVSVASATAMAEQNENAAYRRCIRSPSLFDAGGCLAQGTRRYHPIRRAYSTQLPGKGPSNAKRRPWGWNVLRDAA